MDFSELNRWASGLEKTHKELSVASNFFTTDRATKYAEIARTVGVRTLESLRPDDADPAEWSARVSDFAKLLTHRFAHGNSLEIIYAKYDAIAPNTGGAATITWDDVYRWVTAGPDAGGKDLSDAEVAENRDPRHIAHVVYRAFTQTRFEFAANDYTALEQRLLDWVNQASLSGDLGEYLRAVLQAWLDTLAPIMHRDVESWIDKTLASW